MAHFAPEPCETSGGCEAGPAGIQRGLDEEFCNKHNIEGFPTIRFHEDLNGQPGRVRRNTVREAGLRKCRKAAPLLIAKTIRHYSVRNVLRLLLSSHRVPR